MNKIVYLGLSILELSKIVMYKLKYGYDYDYDYAKPRYGELRFMDTEKFIVYITTYGIYKDIAEEVQTRFESSNYELGRPLPRGKNKKVIGLIKDKLGGKRMKECLRLITKTYSYLIDGGNEVKKRHKIVCHKKKT